MGRAELQAAVVSAVAKAYWDDDDVPLGNLLRQHAAHLAADAAIGVVLAEAQQSIRALPARGDVAFGCIERVEALAALAALGDEALEPPPLV